MGRNDAGHVVRIKHMGKTVRLDNSAAVGQVIYARRIVEASHFDAFSPDVNHALLKSVRKLRWIGLEDEAKAIERLIVDGGGADEVRATLSKQSESSQQTGRPEAKSPPPTERDPKGS